MRRPGINWETSITTSGAYEEALHAYQRHRLDQTAAVLWQPGVNLYSKRRHAEAIPCSRKGSNSRMIHGYHLPLEPAGGCLPAAGRLRQCHGCLPQRRRTRSENCLPSNRIILRRIGSATHLFERHSCAISIEFRTLKACRNRPRNQSLLNPAMACPPDTIPAMDGKDNAAKPARNRIREAGWMDLHRSWPFSISMKRWERLDQIQRRAKKSRKRNPVHWMLPGRPSRRTQPGKRCR